MIGVVLAGGLFFAQSGIIERHERMRTEQSQDEFFDCFQKIFPFTLGYGEFNILFHQYLHALVPLKFFYPV
jgi:hypothetical protein